MLQHGGSFTVNGTTFEAPSVPVLLQILSGAQNAQDLLPSGSVYSLPSNATVELSIPAFAIGGPHPFHLHGVSVPAPPPWVSSSLIAVTDGDIPQHAFSVVRSAGQTEPNYVNPVRRDVVSIGSGTDNVTIRFRVRHSLLLVSFRLKSKWRLTLRVGCDYGFLID